MSEAAGTEDDPLIGAVVDGRYRVLRRLGEGGMGAVYEVQHERIGRRFALKTLHAEYARNAEVVERFHREAQAAGTIGDDHIVEVNDLGQLPSGEPFLVMELLDGRNLADDIAEQAPLPVHRAARIGLQACEALSAAHAKGIIHRDLKPENIVLVARRKESDFIKLVDFGISKFKESNAELGGQSMTRTGTAMGTPYYMSPEQIDGARDIDVRTDVYALGVVLFEALTGQVPFDAPTYPKLVIKIAQEQPPSVREIRADVPEKLDATIRRTLAKDREQRFESVDELAEALAPFAGDDAVLAAGATMAAAGGQARQVDSSAGSRQVDSSAGTRSSGRADSGVRDSPTDANAIAQATTGVAGEEPGPQPSGHETPALAEAQEEAPTEGERIPQRRGPLVLGAVAVLGMAAIGAAIGASAWVNDDASSSAQATSSGDPAPEATGDELPEAPAVPGGSGHDDGSGARGEGASGDEPAAGASGTPDAGTASQDASTKHADKGDAGAVAGHDGGAQKSGDADETSGDRADKDTSGSSAARGKRAHADKEADARKRKRETHRRSDRGRARARDRAARATNTDEGGADDRKRAESDTSSASPQPPQRRVILRNDRRASVTVQLKCGSETVHVEVSAKSKSQLRLPAVDCKVNCSGVGTPSCPLTLYKGESSLVVD